MAQINLGLEHDTKPGTKMSQYPIK